jgi:antirestriction protein ArdC
LEQGVAPWRKPWSTSILRDLISKKPYRGLNVFLLATQGYGSPYWLTFNQAKQLGAHVRQGEKSTLVSFWKFNEYAKENREIGETENKTSALLRYYRVFNIEQCEGLRSLHGDDRNGCSNQMIGCRVLRTKFVAQVVQLGAVFRVIAPVSNGR